MFEPGEIVRVNHESAHEEQRGLLACITTPYNKSLGGSGANIIFLEGPNLGSRGFSRIVKLSPLEKLALCAEGGSDESEV